MLQINSMGGVGLGGLLHQIAQDSICLLPMVSTVVVGMEKATSFSPIQV